MGSAQLDRIDDIAERLEEVGKRYNRLRWLCHKPDASDTFLQLTEAAGMLASESLKQTGDLLAMLWQAGNKEIDGNDKANKT